jgi:hypothetical protein
MTTEWTLSTTLAEIRQRDADSAITWFREPAVGACGRAFIDRRWLLEEIGRLHAALERISEPWWRVTRQIAAEMIAGSADDSVAPLGGNMTDENIAVTSNLRVALTKKIGDKFLFVADGTYFKLSAEEIRELARLAGLSDETNAVRKKYVFRFLGFLGQMYDESGEEVNFQSGTEFYLADVGCRASEKAGESA